MSRGQYINSVVPSPGSPPGMTVSTSKSSSFQSLTSDDDGVGDVGHFEDIGLDDDNVTLKSTSHVSLRRSPSPLAPSTRDLASTKKHPKPRRSFPNLHSAGAYAANPRSTSLTVLTDPRPLQRSVTTYSTPTLPLSHRHRSPSPGLSLNPRNPNRPPKPRRESWQTNRDRRSLADLETECDEDDGDDIPEGFVLDNVPISPRPQNARPPSRGPSVSPSPDRRPKDRSKERVRSVGNGTPPVAQAQGSLRSPTWKTDDVGSRDPIKGRAQSWNAGFANLSIEAQVLTEKLEEHADEQDDRQRRPSSSGRPNTWNSSRRSVENMYQKKERVKSSTPELPPLRRTNIMIDPLPISKEKEAVLSRTRPSWLPPKDPAEERRHVKQYQKMMAASAKADDRREAARKLKSESKDVNVDGLMHIWEQDIIPRWDVAIHEKRTREVWWRGVAPRSRGLVWARAIGNELGLSGSSFHAALARAKALEERTSNGRADSEDARRAKWFEQIRADAEKTYPELRLFAAGGPLHQNLVDVLQAYAMYRSDIGYVSGCNTIAALLLLNLPDAETTFIALANALNRPLPLSFYTGDEGAQASVYNFVLQTLSQKSAALYEHLTKTVRDVDPEMYLFELYTSLFTSGLAVDEAARLWDVFVFEGDALLVRAGVAYLVGREMALLGCKTGEDVARVMNSSRVFCDAKHCPAGLSAEDYLMRCTREAGKE